MPSTYLRLRILVSVLGLAALIFVPAARTLAQDEDSGTSEKGEAELTAPDGATNADAKGKAKTFYVDNGNQIVQRLQVSAQHLDRGVEYQLLVDGIDFGTYSPRGGSGTLVLRFRDPVKGHLLPFPEGEVDVRLFELIEIVNVETGEVVLSGSFAAETGDDGEGGDGTGTGGDDGSGGTGDDGGGSTGGGGGGNGHGNGHGNGGNGGGNGHGNGGGNGHGHG